MRLAMLIDAVLIKVCNFFSQELLIILASCKGLRKQDRDTTTPLNPYVKTVIIPIDPQAAKGKATRKFLKKSQKFHF